MKFIFTVLILVFGISNVFAQTELNKLVQAEKDFAKLAEDKDLRSAYLEYFASDGIVFEPMAVNALEFWSAKQTSPELYSWSPSFADISTNGALGYTTGAFAYRPKGKKDNPTMFGHYVSVWQRQIDGRYKVVLDIGISHPQITLTNNWTSPKDSVRLTENRTSAADTSTQFFETAEKTSIEKAYKMFLAEDARVYRDGKLPFTDKKNALNEIKKNKKFIRFAKRSFFTSAADLAYISNSYTYFDKSNKEIEKGNFLQIWKFKQGRWQIVLDLFSTIPKN